MHMNATEYLYPVGHIAKEGLKLLLIYQKSVHHVELWEWDVLTQEARKALLSSYTPAGITLLPDGSGFSFIDNDTIRIAYSHKRSPALIPLYEPLYDFTTLSWFDMQHCIVSAKEKEHYGIYIINREGECYNVLVDGPSDYRYPNLLTNQLFYIHMHGNNYSIKQTTVDLTTLTATKKITAQDIFNRDTARTTCPTHDTETLLTYTEQAIAFLTMRDELHGFYVLHPTRIDRHDLSIIFEYHALTKLTDTWQSSYLFSFSLPMAYLLDPHERLHESILPFLPKVHGDTIYYFDCIRGTIATQLFMHNLITKFTTQVTHVPQSVMGIYFGQTTCWYGGTLQEHTADKNVLPVVWIHPDKELCVDMPKLTI